MAASPDTFEQIDQFDNLFPFLLHATLPKCGIHAFPGVGTQQLSLGFGRLDLVQDVDAVSIVYSLDRSQDDLSGE